MYNRGAFAYFFLCLRLLGAEGGIQLAWSYDGGETWTDTHANNGRPFLSYSNKSHIQRLDSGNLLFIVGCSTSGRENLTAFLSEDNGKTWPYSLSLDARDHFGDWFGCGYPEAANLQGKNGEIYVVWDARFSYTEIACAKFTEADIRAGRIVTEGCYTYNTVVRNANVQGNIVSDIDGVKEEFEKYITVELGAEEGDINSRLPSRLTAIDGEKTYSLNGTWVCPDYDSSRAGRYTFRFDTPDLPVAVGDSYGYLTVNVEVKEKKNKGCGSVGVGGASLAVALGGILPIKKIRRK